MLHGDERVVHVIGREAPEHLPRLVVVPMVEQPSWRLRQPGDCREEGDDEDGLEGEWKAPGNSASGKRQAVVDPIA